MIEKVQITISSIQEDFSNGYVWYKRDDIGYGSIQDKWNMTDFQITNIKKHPKLKDIQTTARIFEIIDDTKEIIADFVKLSSQQKELIGDTIQKTEKFLNSAKDSNTKIEKTINNFQNNNVPSSTIDAWENL
jgi:DNA-binding transcriptional MerR regulator